MRFIAAVTLTAFGLLSICPPGFADQGTKLYYYHYDHLGSVNMVTDENGQVVQRIEYKPFGEPYLVVGQNVSAHKFTGKQLDNSTGLYYYGARYYDPQLGRFIQPDALIPDPGDPQDLNRYTYAGNNPVNYTDPTGHFKFKKFFKSLLSGAITAFAAIILGPAIGPILAGGIASALGGTAHAALTGGDLGRGALFGGAFGFATAGLGYGIADTFGNVARQIYDASIVIASGVTAGVQGGFDSFLGGITGAALVTGVASGFSYGEASSLQSQPEPQGFWDTAWDVLSFGYSLRQFKQNPGWGTGLSLFADSLALLAPGVPGGAGYLTQAGKAGFAAGKGKKLVIGKMDDLSKPGALLPGEYKLAWPHQGIPKANWKMNSHLLRVDMQKGIPIRDASPNKGGGFLSAERNLLRNRGWKYNDETGHWHPPG